MPKLLLLLLLPILALGIFSHVPATAQSGDGPVSQFLEVNPARLDIAAQRGTTTRQEVTITNKHTARVNLRVAFENILPNGETGETRPAKEPTPYDLRKLATVGTADFGLAPRESRKVPVSIAVPTNESPGGFYGMLRFSPVKADGDEQVAVQGDIATLFLVRVPGPAQEEGSLKELYASKTDGSRVGSLVIGNELNLVSKINNGGNVHFSTAPAFETTDQFGKAGLKTKLDGRNVFPKSDRRFEAKWSSISSGYHTVKATADFPNKPGQQQTIKIFVISPLVAVMLLVALLLLIILIITLVRRHRRNRPRL